MSKDLLVNLYELSAVEPQEKDIHVYRILAPDIHRLELFVKTHFSANWVSEILVGCYKVNPTVFIAVKHKDIVGFAGYDCTGKGYFGPTGVQAKYQGQGIGRILLLKTLEAMKADGYGYAIIGGGEGKFAFYHKVAHATLIDSTTSIYERMLK